MEQLMSGESVNFILVFLEGIFSFFSPCIIPLIPLYISYLAGNAKIVNEDGNITYKRGKVFTHTLFFVIGISFAFFILGLSFSALGSFFNDIKMIFTKLGGVLIIILGLVQLGVLEFNFMKKERRLNVNLGLKKMNPIKALLLGFTFSFAWTPCVGPALGSVLIMASGAQTPLLGNMLVMVYTFGFVLPFLLMGVFTSQVLNFIKKNQNMIKYVIKAGGVILIILGVMTFTGWINNISGYLNSISPNSTITSEESSNQGNNNSSNVDNSGSVEKEESTQQENPVIPAPDFELKDQYGNTHKLSDYKGKVIFLNFWATWCPPCKQEMPYIEELYKEYNLNKDEVVILGVAQPGGREPDAKGIGVFLEENNYTFPTVFDETGEVAANYFISAYPTTYMIDKNGDIFGYVTGGLTKGNMKNIINQTLEGR